ncbi:MAG: tRNA 2-thiocytidine biosynthesis protein TtcA [Ruminococcaceae bacterium]|nr:tRNA 2-thiocytidine biosynthesis protein TtcA [Oscillospiraceae bacterium]
MKKILSTMRRAIEDYNMIEDGDKIAIGVSGGKDSLVLLKAFWHLKMFYPKDFQMVAITLDLGYVENDYTPIVKLCEELQIEYKVIKTNIKEVVFDIRNEKNPCALCAKLRGGALHNAAIDEGCNKVCLGHHFDDVIETFFLSLFYEGRINCFSPVNFLDRKKITLIRPFIYTTEKEIRGVAKRHNLPVCKNPCPADGNTKRQAMKEFVAEKFLTDKGFKDRIFNAVCTSGIDGWKKEGRKQRVTDKKAEN